MIFAFFRKTAFPDLLRASGGKQKSYKKGASVKLIWGAIFYTLWVLPKKKIFKAFASDTVNKLFIEIFWIIVIILKCLITERP